MRSESASLGTEFTGMAELDSTVSLKRVTWAEIEHWEKTIMHRAFLRVYFFIIHNLNFKPSGESSWPYSKMSYLYAGTRSSICAISVALYVLANALVLIKLLRQIEKKCRILPQYGTNGCGDNAETLFYVHADRIVSQ